VVVDIKGIKVPSSEDDDYWDGWEPSDLVEEHENKMMQKVDEVEYLSTFMTDDSKAVIKKLDDFVKAENTESPGFEERANLVIDEVLAEVKKFKVPLQLGRYGDMVAIGSVMSDYLVTLADNPDMKWNPKAFRYESDEMYYFPLETWDQKEPVSDIKAIRELFYWYIWTDTKSE